MKYSSLYEGDWRVSGGCVIVRVGPGLIGVMFIYPNVVLTIDSVRLQTEQHTCQSGTWYRDQTAFEDNLPKVMERPAGMT
jgi:hypothetical protein